MQRFHHTQFADTRRLCDLKRAAGSVVSVCIPTLNEAATIGHIVGVIRSAFVDDAPLVDEILVIDSGSNDGTRTIAADAGATVRLSAEIAPETGSHTGKGENLWKALHAAKGDIICYLDGDVANFHPGFVAGLVGPLLENPETGYVKAYYERPLVNGDSSQANGGGRVSEILVRPFISMFYPELSGILQPLAGEYAARRQLLESLPFPTGYGVEIAHLIDLLRMGKLECIAQTDLACRVHRNRDDGDLGDTAFAILRVMLRRLERDGKISINGPLADLHQRWLIDENGVESVTKHIPEPERPPGVPSPKSRSPRRDHRFASPDTCRDP
ncbi:MAG TPA: glucosyl-3-phosphoglycerate synthase [Luteolibacter sp.]|nr:glucosyl-3-phosphoglycerate synthase [Luteolibacter sp.]